jgi:cell division protease FtsH
MAILVRNLFVFFTLLFFCFVVGLVFILENKLPTRDYSEFFRNVQAGEVEELVFVGNCADVTLLSGFTYSVEVPDVKKVTSLLDPSRVTLSFRKDYTSYYFQGALFLTGVMLALVVLLTILANRREGAESRFASDKLIIPNNGSDRITFDNVAGVPEAKEELEEVVSFLKNPHQFSKIGASIPKGLLLQGPPGTGKTLLARAIAGEAGVPFYSFSGSDFVEMFVGVGASRVRDLFSEAKKNAPCIVFIDEIDAVGSSRTAASSDGQDERGQTLNALLVEMDGFSSSDTIIVLASTNRPDILDAALSRPGRFDRRITLLPPDLKGRQKILDVHCRKVKLRENVDLEEIARITSGFTGAELANLVNEAALLAGRDGCDAINGEHFDLARDRIMLGVERKGVVLTEKDKQVLAFHEAGHAIVAKMLPDSDPVHKITIIPRGRALGQTQQLPMGDRTAYSRTYLKNRITILLGGRAAEKIIFNRRTTRAENDLLQATEIATNMVCRWGMSEKLGPQAYGVGDSSFLGDEMTRRLVMSSETANLIDGEIKSLLSECYGQAAAVLEDERLFLKALAEILLQVETIDSEEFEIIYQCSLTKKEKARNASREISECSVCPAKGHCLEAKVA